MSPPSREDRRQSADDGDADNRRSRRLKVFFPTALMVEGDAVRAHVLDLSALGSLLHVGKATVGGTVVLRLADAYHDATIVWTQGDRVGLRFHRDLSAQELSAVVEMTSNMVVRSEGSRR